MSRFLHARRMSEKRCPSGYFPLQWTISVQLRTDVCCRQRAVPSCELKKCCRDISLCPSVLWRLSPPLQCVAVCLFFFRCVCAPTVPKHERFFRAFVGLKSRDSPAVMALHPTHFERRVRVSVAIQINVLRPAERATIQACHSVTSSTVTRA